MKTASIILLLIFLFGFRFPDTKADPDPLSAQAFEILETKCNGCHQQDSPSNVFTLENMDSFAKKIYKQVFVKKRMPKGKEVVLTEAELKVLQDWVIELGGDEK